MKIITSSHKIKDDLWYLIHVKGYVSLNQRQRRELNFPRSMFMNVLDIRDAVVLQGKRTII